jgi:hypothetical protein
MQLSNFSNDGKGRLSDEVTQPFVIDQLFASRKKFLYVTLTS